MLYLSSVTIYSQKSLYLQHKKCQIKILQNIYLTNILKNCDFKYLKAKKYYNNNLPIFVPQNLIKCIS